MNYLQSLSLQSWSYKERDETGLTAKLADGELPALEELDIGCGIGSVSDPEDLARGQWPCLKVLKLHRSSDVSKKQVY